MSLNLSTPQGQSFSLLVALPEDTSPGQFASWDVKCQLRRFGSRLPKDLIADLDVALVDTPANIYLLTAPGSTDDWPVGAAELDLLFTNTGEGGQSIRTDPLSITIVRGVTRR